MYLCLEQRHTYTCFCSKECTSSNWKKPADLAEIRVFYQDRFLCRAICQELAGQTISLKKIEKARSERRKQVREELGVRAAMVDRYVEIHYQPTPERKMVVAEPAQSDSRPPLKRYIND